MKPTIGRIVHFESPDLGTIAAMITAVSDGFVGLAVFPPGKMPGWVSVGTECNPTAIPFAEVPTPGHWNWPPRD